jgi:hypothetical protein
MTPPATCTAAQHFSDAEPTVYSSPGPCLSFPFLQIFTRRCCGPHVKRRRPAASGGVQRRCKASGPPATWSATRRCPDGELAVYCYVETCASFPSRPLPDAGSLPNHAVSIYPRSCTLISNSGQGPLTPTHYPCDPSSQRCTTIHLVQ